MKFWRRGAMAWAAVVIASSMAMSGCAKNTESTGGPQGEAVTASKDASLAAMVPDDIAKRGVLKIGVGATYPPNEYRDSNNNIVGWDIELFDAVAAKLGLETNYVEATFPQILGGMDAGAYDLGVSSFTDTKEREQQVDFVDYYSAGIQWASPKGSPVDEKSACGKKVAAQVDTYQLLEYLPQLSKQCTQAGKPEIAIQSYDDQAMANTAVGLGKVDATVADSPVIAYAVKKSDDKLELSSDVLEAAPYGFPVKKGSKLGPAFVAALKAIKADGTYDKILERWGVEDGAIDTFSLNGAIY